MSSMDNYTDRATCPIFGDGAAAFMVEPTTEEDVYKRQVTLLVQNAWAQNTFKAIVKDGKNKEILIGVNLSLIHIFIIWIYARYHFLGIDISE